MLSPPLSIVGFSGLYQLVQALAARSRAAWDSLLEARIRVRNSGNGKDRSREHSSEPQVGVVDYGLVEPFDIGGKQLAGVSRQDCFCLGAEFAMLRNQLLTTPEPFKTLCLPANAERISAMAKNNNRFCEIGPATDGWCLVRVGDQLV